MARSNRQASTATGPTRRGRSAGNAALERRRSNPEDILHEARTQARAATAASRAGRVARGRSNSRSSRGSASRTTPPVRGSRRGSSRGSVAVEQPAANEQGSAGGDQEATAEVHTPRQTRQQSPQQSPVSRTSARDFATPLPPLQTSPARPSSTNRTSAQSSPTKKSPTKKSPTQKSTTQKSPTQPTPVQPLPVQNSPTQHSAQSSSIEATSVQVAPTEATTTHLSSAQQTPVVVSESPTAVSVSTIEVTESLLENGATTAGGSHLEAEQSSNPKGEGKRDRDSHGETDGDPKRQKGEQPAGQANGNGGDSNLEGSRHDAGSGDDTDNQEEVASGDSVSSCAHMAERLAAYQQVTWTPQGYRDPVTKGRMMFYDDVLRAITAVSEPRAGFAIMNDSTMQQPVNTVMPENYRIGRPEHEVLVPWTDKGHTSLFILRLRRQSESGESESYMELLHRDSARRHGHRGDGSNASPATMIVRQKLLHAGWDGGALDIHLPERQDSTAAQQQLVWTCGIHTVFNAWAYAMDLRICGQPIEKYDEFIETGMAIIRLAVLARMDSRTIWAFFVSLKDDTF